MTEDNKKFKHRVKSILTFRNLVIFGTLIIFISIILFMQIGESESTEYNKAKRPITLKENPQSFDIPNQSSNGSIGGFNITQDFEDLPGFNVPGELASSLPESFGSGTYGGIPDISEIADSPLGNGPNGISGNPIDIPNINNPDLPGSNKPPVVTNPGSPPIIDNPGQSFPTNNNTNNARNTTIGNRVDKARNLPKLDFINLDFINLNFFSISNLTVEITVTSFLFMSLIFLPLIVDSVIIPKILDATEDFEAGITAENTFFFKPKVNLAELKRRKDHIRKLLIFKDHVNELIDRSEVRLINETPSDTIIKGYHELDMAFAEFVNLKRTKSITPLEHAHTQFKTGEIDNEILEKIVDIFYLARYSRQNLNLEHGREFVDLLTNLVIDKSEINSRLQDVDQEIINTGAKN